ncbi:MAG: XTP/dITP diphosphatase [Dehalococcoidales bacterium]|nr:XTP/dITP diphosphatase [Dehalococcoidales bacterium]
MQPKLLLATNNLGKLREYRSLLRGIPFDLMLPTELGIKIKVEETGKTYRENARLKAVTLANESGILSLADDSGLEVDALNGEPGVMSARYAGKDASDRERVNYLLSKLKNVSREKRTARFVCVIAIASPEGPVKFRSGKCYGFITFKPQGEHGFGYDPIFYFPELSKTMAELPPDVKNKVSHRGHAAQKARLVLQKLAGEKS